MELSQLLLDYENKVPTKDLQKKYNLSWNKLTTILKEEGVYVKNNSLCTPNKSLEYIKKNYMLFSNKEIAEKLNINEDWLRVLAKKLNLPIKGSGWKHNLSIESLDYNSNEFYYFLGWIAADGNISRNLQSITLAITDEEVSKRFTKLFPTASVYFKPHNNKKDQYIFHLCSKKLISHLVEIGLTPAKTKTLQVQTSIWNTHFLRGFFEGDGHVRKTKEGAKYIRYSVGFVCASEDFIRDLEIFLLTYEISCTIKKESTYFRLSINGKILVNKFYNLVYNDCGEWYLSRKKQILDQLFSNE